MSEVEAAMSPMSAVDSLYRRSLASRQGGRRVLRGRLVLDGLLAASGSSAPGADVRRLHDRDDVVQLLMMLGSEARHEVLGFVPDGAYPSGELAESRQLDHELLDRGVASHYVYEPGWIYDGNGSDYMADLATRGAEVRIADRVPHRLMIYDRTVAVLPIDPGDVGHGALLVQEHSIVRSLQGLFRGVWHRSTVRELFDPEADRGCDQRTRKVLELMSNGSTDETAARNLDVSVRTYRRYVADLMRKLDAQSRFQAGVRAVERGWL